MTIRGTKLPLAVIFVLGVAGALYWSPSLRGSQVVPKGRFVEQAPRPHRFSQELRTQVEERVEVGGLTVQVTSTLGDPIQGALVVDPDAGRAPRCVDDEGRVSTPHPIDGRLTATAQGHLPRTVMVEASQTEVRIVLERASTIEGRVVHIDGSGASNAFVLAWAQEWPAQSAVWDGMAGVDDSVAIARCDEEGVFSLPATQGMEVQLTAGLPGSLMFGPNSLPATTEETVELTVRPVYGAMIRYRTEESEVSVSDSLQPVNGTGIRYPQGVLRVHPGHPALPFVGVDPAWTAAENPLDHFLIMGAEAGVFLDHLPPLVLTADVPGYAPIRRELRLPHLLGGFHEEVVTLVQSVGGFARLEVHFDLTVAERLEPSKLLSGGVRLRMHDVGAGRIYGYFLKGFDAAGVATIDDVPLGAYEVHLQSWDNTFFDLAPGDPGVTGIDLDLGRPGVTLDLRDLRAGSVEFDVRRRDGAQYDGALLVNLGRLRQDGRRASYPYHFVGRPYRIPVLKDGDYGAFLDGKWFQEVFVDDDAVFHLTADGDRTITVHQPAADEQR
ncbi:MAG: hypothetical protein O2816_13935 [Planctomycetota bacterium]|nr:hypothetical protein [Planctomycetota bacterium]